MKKLLLPVLVVIVMLASVSPAFAKGKPPTNPGQGAQKHSVTPAPKENGKPDKNVEKQNGKNKGLGAQNFVLFGVLGTETDTVTSVVTPSETTVDTIMVTIESGNRLAQQYIGKTVTVEVPAGAQIKFFKDGKATWGTLADLKANANGQTIRVHGWWTPPAETVEPSQAPTDDTTGEGEESVPGTWTARQVYTNFEDEAEAPFDTVD